MDRSVRRADSRRRSRSTTLRREGLIDPPDGRRRAAARRHRPGAAVTSRRPTARCGCRPGVTRLRRGELERHRDRLDLRRSRHLQEVQGPDLGGSAPVHRLDERSFTREQLATGWRLACLAQATRTCRSTCRPLTTRPKAATVGVGRQVILRPALQKRYVELTEPTLSDQRTDLRAAARRDRRPRADASTSRPAPAADGAARSPTSRSPRWSSTTSSSTSSRATPRDRRYAIAFDLGTTTVVATLLDIATGTPAAVASMLNKQQPFGGDVITRISATMMDPEALTRLRGAGARDARRAGRATCCDEAGVDPAEVYEVALAGNATMTALALGIDPEPLGVAPFIMSTATLPPAARHRPRAGACTPAPAPSSSPPSVPTSAATSSPACSRRAWTATSGCGCSSTSAPTARSCSATATRIVSTAAPAGPAFEGGAIRCGMRAADGAIEVVKIDADDEGGVELQVIGDVEPQGLCGSGLVDAVAELVRAGLLDAAGRFITDERPPSWRRTLADRLDRDQRGAGLRAAPARARRPARGARLPLASATCASCSSPRPRSRPGGRCCSRSSASSRATSSRCCWPGSFGSYLSPAARRADRPGAEAPGAADRQRRQRRRRRREDGAAERARARRRPGAAGGGDAMSSSPTAPTSTTGSSTSSPSPAERPTGTTAWRSIACGAIAQPCAEVVERARLAGRRAPAAAAAAQPPGADRRRGRAGSPSELRAALRRGRGRLRRLRHLRRARRGLRAARDAPARGAALLRRVRRRATGCAACFEEQPGTYVLTDFLVRSFGAPSSPSSAWTATPSCATTTSPTTRGWCGWRSGPTTRSSASSRERAADRIGLPLTVVPTGDGRLEHALAGLLTRR